MSTETTLQHVGQHTTVKMSTFDFPLEEKDVVSGRGVNRNTDLMATSGNKKYKKLIKEHAGEYCALKEEISELEAQVSNREQESCLSKVELDIFKGRKRALKERKTKIVDQIESAFVDCRFFDKHNDKLVCCNKKRIREKIVQALKDNEDENMEAKKENRSRRRGDHDGDATVKSDKSSEREKLICRIDGLIQMSLRSEAARDRSPTDFIEKALQERLGPTMYQSAPSNY